MLATKLRTHEWLDIAIVDKCRETERFRPPASTVVVSVDVHQKRDTVSRSWRGDVERLSRRTRPVVIELRCGTVCVPCRTGAIQVDDIKRLDELLRWVEGETPAAVRVVVQKPIIARLLLA